MIAVPMAFTAVDADKRAARTEIINKLVIAGWTGRNVDALEKHIRELEEMGVARPKSAPIYYRVSAALLTTAPHIEVIGGDSSGEAEFVMFRFSDGLWVGVGSDHTDRKAETQGVTLSKQMCAKPIAPEIWPYAEVQPHWEQLMLRSWIVENGERVLYQEGSVAAMRSPENLFELYKSHGGKLELGNAMFCGTHAAKGGIRWSPVFEIELEDPVMRRKINHRYEIHPLPVEG